MVKRSTLPRTITPANPAAQAPCTKCGQRHGADSGVLLAAGYTYAILEQAEALVQLGRGRSYPQAGKSLRVEAGQARQPGRPTCRNRPWLPRGDLKRNQEKAAALAATKPTVETQPPVPQGPAVPAWRKYEYRTSQPITRSNQYSKSGTTVASYLDIFGPCIIAAFAPTKMPSVLAIDSKPIKRRAWAADKYGAVNQAHGGQRNGEMMVMADASAVGEEAFPILAALEGGKDSESWRRLFARLPAGPAPVWVVADLDPGIEIAVRATWKDATLFRCEQHLRERMRLALVADDIPRKVTPAEAVRLGVEAYERTPIKAVRRGDVEKRTHPLHTLVNRSLKSPEDWEALKVGIEGLIPKTTTKFIPDDKVMGIRKWIADNESTILEQFVLKEQNPDMPKSAGGVEETLKRIGEAIGKRSEFFANARRLELIIGLVRIEALGLANAVTYSEVIREMIAARGGAAMEWAETRDVLGCGFHGFWTPCFAANGHPVSPETATLFRG